MSQKHILVTGANSGIGKALCKLLATDHDCYVYLGSRNADRGREAINDIVRENPSVKDKIELVEIDVSSDESVENAYKTLKGVLGQKKLYALVNNAGVGLAHGKITTEDLMNTNYKGPKRVTEKMVELIDSECGRVVNVSSGVASMWLRDQDDKTKELYSNHNLTSAELDANIAENIKTGNVGMGNGYGLSKAALTALTQIQANDYPSLKVVSLSPGFIATKMTEGFGAKLTPEQGCISSLKCLFQPVTSGFYYGSDGLRSPLVCTRDPGTPEYEGEANPDPKKYNKN